MKVLQILPELESGGVERGTLEISKALVAAGYESVVVSNGGRLVSQLEAEGGKHIQALVHKKSVSSLFQVRPLRKLLVEEGIDIIHARSRIPAWISYLAWKGMPKGRRPRFMTTFHGFHSVSPYSEIMAKGERVIAVSNTVKAHIVESYPKTDSSKITINHRGVDDQLYTYGYKPPEGSEAMKLRNKAEGKFVITLPGRVTGWKGGEDFIQVTAELKALGIPVQAWFAGGVHEKRGGYYEELKALVAKKGLQEDVCFLGHRSDLIDVMAVSDVVASFSTKPEAFGRVSLEALRLGVPVLGYDHGGVSEQLEALFSEGKVPLSAMNDAVSKLATWYGSRPVVERVENPFSLQKMQEKTLEVYRDLSEE